MYILMGVSQIWVVIFLSPCPDEPEEGVNYEVVLINCCPSVLCVLIQLPHGSLLVSQVSLLALIGWIELTLATAGLLISCELIAKCLIIVLNFSELWCKSINCKNVQISLFALFLDSHYTRHGHYIETKLPILATGYSKNKAPVLLTVLNWKSYRFQILLTIFIFYLTFNCDL